MRIAMIGTGYVGLVSGACFSEFGLESSASTRTRPRSRASSKGEIPIYEPGLDTLVGTNVKAGRLRFQHRSRRAPSRGADAVFIAVGTPSRRGDGHADLSYVYAAAEEIADAIDGYTVVVTKSTVPVGTGREVERIIRRRRPDADFDVASNPEFLREGSAIDGFHAARPRRDRRRDPSAPRRRAARALPAALPDRDADRVHRRSRPPSSSSTRPTPSSPPRSPSSTRSPICARRSAPTCRTWRAASGSTAASAASSCTRARATAARASPRTRWRWCAPRATGGAPLKIVEAVVAVNDARKRAMARKVIDACGGSVSGKTVAVLGLTFKPNTDDMREAPSLDIVPALQAAGATVRAFDPEGMNEAKKHAARTSVWCEDAYDAHEGRRRAGRSSPSGTSSARSTCERARTLMRSPVMVDLRNIYRSGGNAPPPASHYSSIGRADAVPVPSPRTVRPASNGRHGMSTGRTQASIRRSCANTTFAASSARRSTTADATRHRPCLRHHRRQQRRHARMRRLRRAADLARARAGRRRRRLTAAGIDVIVIGLGPTPMLYFAVHELGADGGIMVTGSHNPPDYNGFKMMLGKAPFFGDDIQTLGAVAAAGEFAFGQRQGRRARRCSTTMSRGLLKDYRAGPRRCAVALGRRQRRRRRGDGAADRAGCRGEHVAAEREDRRHVSRPIIPDPTVPENLEQLQRKVTRREAAISASPSTATATASASSTARAASCGATSSWCCWRATCSSGIRAPPSSPTSRRARCCSTRSRALGGKPLMWRTGHSLIKAKMAETGAPLAGEMSGHIFFADGFYGFDDALYAAVRLLNMVGNIGSQAWPRCATSCRRWSTRRSCASDCADERKFEVIDEVKAAPRRSGRRGERHRRRAGRTPATAGGCCAPPTPRPCWSRAARRPTRPGSARLKETLSGQLRKSGIEPPAF